MKKHLRKLVAPVTLAASLILPSTIAQAQKSKRGRPPTARHDIALNAAKAPAPKANMRTQNVAQARLQGRKQAPSGQNPKGILIDMKDQTIRNSARSKHRRGTRH